MRVGTCRDGREDKQRTRPVMCGRCFSPSQGIIPHPHHTPGRGQEQARARVSRDGGTCSLPVGAVGAALCGKEEDEISDGLTGPWRQMGLSGVTAERREVRQGGYKPSVRRPRVQLYPSASVSSWKMGSSRSYVCKDLEGHADAGQTVTRKG